MVVFGFLVWVISGVVIAAGAAVGLWFLLGPGPRRARLGKRAGQLLAAGNWQQALAMVRREQENQPPQPWKDRLQLLQAECLHAAGNAGLSEGRYEDAFQYFHNSATLRNADTGQARQQVVEAMIDEVRARFSAGQDINALLDRALKLQPASAEVYFWRAIQQAREGPVEKVLSDLDQAHQLGNKQHIDPPLYLGVLLQRQGKSQDALRVLADANRVDAACPFVALQMGLALVSSGGDSAIALRVLQRALGPKGLPLWKPRPERAWVEAFPEGRSFVRRLAEKHAFSCPVHGPDLQALIRQGEIAVGQAQYRLGNLEESAATFNKLLQEAAPTLPVLRGLGLALARLGKYDQAFKHLRAALEMEPGHGMTAAYLALCGAKGEPSQPEDKPKNVAWALRQLARFDGTGNVEYAAILNTVHAEARRLRLNIPKDDLIRTCAALASVGIHDAEAGGAYLLLLRKHPEAVQDTQAWLFARAAVEHGVQGEGELDLLARVFRDRAGAQAFFGQHSWDLEDVEFVYLERTAAAHPGAFPAALGPEYPPRGEQFLSERSKWFEEMEDLAGAQRAATVWLLLAPQSIHAHDRAAELHHRLGERDHALRLLEAWQSLAPHDPLPWLRRAVLEQQQGQIQGCVASIEKTLEIAQGPTRAKVALLGARLMLKFWGATQENSTVSPLEHAERLLLHSAAEDPEQREALWMLAALNLVRGKESELVELASSMNQADEPDPRFQLLAAIANLLAGQLDIAQRAAVAVTASPELAGEGQYLLALCHLERGEAASAVPALQKSAAGNTPSAEHARALLGALQLRGGVYSEAIKAWTSLDAGKRAAWKLDEPLRQTVYLAALGAFKTGQFEQAAERFREAGRLGVRERRLGQLIGLSLFKAGQRLLFPTA